MNVEWNNCAEVERTPGMVGGAWVFCGTRVPVLALFDNHGHSDADSLRSPTPDRAGAAAEDSA